MAEIISLTQKAQEQAKVLLDKEEESKEGLRVAVIGGGCSGLQYKLGWANADEADAVHEYDNGLKVLVDEKSALFLLGAQLEYHNDINRNGFEVINPSASTTCGCGKSFS
jgi:iron-sulfur cluster assembly protein